MQITILFRRITYISTLKLITNIIYNKRKLSNNYIIHFKYPIAERNTWYQKVISKRYAHSEINDLN